MSTKIKGDGALPNRIDLMNFDSSVNDPLFKIRFGGFDYKDYVITYLEKEQLMHHDYRGKIYIRIYRRYS